MTTPILRELTSEAADVFRSLTLLRGSLSNAARHTEDQYVFDKLSLMDENVRRAQASLTACISLVVHVAKEK
jgi:hypothetical protein